MVLLPWRPKLKIGTHRRGFQDTSGPDDLYLTFTVTLRRHLSAASHTQTDTHTHTRTHVNPSCLVNVVLTCGH